MQPVADLHVLDVAEEGVEAGERLLRRRRRAGSRIRPASPEASRALEDLARADGFMRRGSSPSAAAYSSISGSTSAAAPDRPDRVSGGVMCPIVTAPSRRLACAASPGLLTMKG